MQLGFVCTDEPDLVDRVLREVSERAAAMGLVLAGTVHTAKPPFMAEKCRIVLNVLPDGPVCDISLDLGPGASGCRLDAGALEEVALLVDQRLPAAQALVVNKFGKQEAVGRGLVDAMGKACDSGLPVLVGVSPEWLAAFLTFAGAEAERLPPVPDQVLDWLTAASTTAPPPANPPRVSDGLSH